MFVGYVSNERYVAVPDVVMEFIGPKGSTSTRSTASGTVYADVEAGQTYDVVLYRQEYGSKRGKMTVDPENPYHFRLLSDGLVGYMWPKCVASGESSEFRVHGIEEYGLELWRYGAEKKFVRRIGTFDEHGPRATMQISPNGDYTQTGVEWNKHGYHSKALCQFQTAPDRSGLYYMHARSKSGDFFAFPWIVTPKEPTCKLAVLASDITWNAYNSFGGRSNYIHADCFPKTPTVNSRLELKRYTEKDHRTYDSDVYAPLSLDRPDPYQHIAETEQLLDPIAGRQGCHMASAEWRLLGWMERNNIPYDFYSETLFHFDKVPLESYNTLLISTHPEYWSRHMYDTLKDWIWNKGGKLIYLGGNGLNCEVEFLDDHHIVYQNTNFDHHAPPKDAAGNKFESRFHNRYESEANLLGVVFTFPGIMTAAPYQVIDPSNWCFEGTGLKKGAQFGHNSQHQRVPGGASGHETDKISPRFSPRTTKLLAQGLNADKGGADMIHYTTPSGGEVFSVGSITWPACVLVDEPVSKITANVIRRFTEG